MSVGKKRSRLGSAKLTEFDTHSHALLFGDAGGGIRVFKVVPYRLAVEFKINGPGLILLIPVHGEFIAALPEIRI
jgi:hypothetical protein